MNFFFWNFEKNKTLIATFKGLYPHIGAFKKNVFEFRKDNTLVHIWGCVVLNHLLYGIPFGTKLKIIYLGKEKTLDSKHPCHNYKVEILEIGKAKEKIKK